MCGIFGVFSADPQRQFREEHLAPMVDALVHRGPDHRALRCTPGLAFGHTRLAVLDLGPQANQPIGEGAAGELVYNGEIYNFRALSLQLERSTQEPTGDTRVLLEWLRQEGLAGLDELNGMFAFGFHERGRDRLHLARDPIGQKPLYYLVHDDCVWFASEAQVLRRVPGFQARLDPQVLSVYMATGTTELLDGRTLIEGIRALPPGHQMSIDRGFDAVTAPRPIRWFDLSPMTSPVGRVREHLAMSVKDRLVSEVPLGAMLSGGVDSALLVSLIAEHRPLDGLKTFAVGYEGSRDDLHWAETVAADLGVQHHSLRLSRREYLKAMDEATLAQGAPLCFGNEPALLRVCGLAKEHVTVVLGGEGADEAFAGYKAIHAADHLRRRAAAAHRGLLSEDGQNALQRSFGGLPPAHPTDFFLSVYHWLSFPERHHLYRDDFQARIQGDSALFHHADGLFSSVRSLPSPLSRYQGVLIQDHLQRLLRRLDAVSMRFGLEVRAPYCATDVLNSGLGVPDEHKLRFHHGDDLDLKQTTSALEGKRLLRSWAKERGLRTWCRPKNPFAAPFLHWFGAEHRDHWHPVVFRAGGIERFLDMDRLEVLLSANPNVNTAFKTWQLYALSRWLELSEL
ncbi:MAG: asparagine synthase (glutamine-hydrolyzing) [Myxococcota bacterium]|nr:asparagine synthase (glutamine-hydrolyzing) [Myxococcota bacterium]